MDKFRTLKSLAAHGSISYGLLSPDRLKDVLLGQAPSAADLPKIEQAVTETPLASFYTLARELDVTFEMLDARARQLFGISLEEMQQWQPGGHS